jgi:multiple sugar transport system substrate-binding protein
MFRAVTPIRSGLGAVVALSLALTALGGGAVTVAQSESPSTGPAASLPAAGSAGTVTVGSNYSDPVPLGAFQSMISYCDGQAGTTSTVNTTEHNKFQEQINTYLQGTPEDVFTWFAGFRMRFFAAQGLATDLSDVWNDISSNYSDAFKAASTGDDGKQYFIPMYNYPWVVLYRKSVFAQNGWTVPTTWDDFTTLAAKIQAAGMVPLAFADKDGWPAMGTFDILNMRLNGYQFHIDLMAGKEKWTDPKVQAVFEFWKTLLPFTQPNALGRTWQEGAQSLINNEAAMYFLGTFAGQQATDPAVHDDLDFFPFPTLGTQYDAEMAIDAPIDGLMLSKAPANIDGAKALVKCVSTGAAQLKYLAADPNSVAAAKDADTSGYTPFQAKSAQIIGSAGAIAQFLDRDTDPGFAQNTMQSKLQAFLTDPNQDLPTLLTSIQNEWDLLGQ